MPSKWIEHIKAFAAKNNLSYGCALSDPQCRATYTPVKKTTQKKERESMGGEDINRAGAPFKKPVPEPPKLTGAQAFEVFTNPDLLKTIGSFTNPNSLKKKLPVVDLEKLYDFYNGNQLFKAWRDYNKYKEDENLGDFAPFIKGKRRLSQKQKDKKLSVKATELTKKYNLPTNRNWLDDYYERWYDREVRERRQEERGYYTRR